MTASILDHIANKLGKYSISFGGKEQIYLLCRKIYIKPPSKVKCMGCPGGSVA